MDFLKANPHVTREDYLWKWTIPQIKLATYDSTHIEYSKSKKSKGKKSKNKSSNAENVLRLDSTDSINQWMSSNGGKIKV